MVGEPPEKKIPPMVKTFSCTNCGAEVQVKYSGLTMSATCPACKALIDVTNSNYRILQEFGKMMVRKPKIPLGTRAKLYDKTWELIGFIVRDDSGYVWDEYLLFNPYYGYRWLVENMGHWNFTTMVKERPSERPFDVVFQNKLYKKYNMGTASVSFVLGEFYWRVNLGTKVKMDDFIAPPFMLSREESGSDIVWSHSEYLDHKEVEKAFKVSLSAPIGVGANQEFASQREWNQMKLLWLMFSALLTIFAYGCGVSARTATVFDDSVIYQHNGKVSNTTLKTFPVRGKHGTLKVSVTAPGLDNSWVWMAGEIVNDDDGTTIPFERNLEYYHGYDDGEYWSEGSTSQDFIVQNLPEGNYYINIDTESGDFHNTNTDTFQIQVVRNPVQFSNYFWSLLMLSLLPALYWYNSRNLEMSRWSNSDFSPYSSWTSNSGSSSDY